MPRERPKPAHDAPYDYKIRDGIVVAKKRKVSNDDNNADNKCSKRSSGKRRNQGPVLKTLQLSMIRKQRYIEPILFKLVYQHRHPYFTYLHSQSTQSEEDWAKSVQHRCISHPSEAAWQDPMEGWNALHYALMHKPPVEVVRSLLETNADIARVRTRRGSSALHIACYYGASPYVILLLVRTANDMIRKKNRQGHTPISCALRARHGLVDEQAIISLFELLSYEEMRETLTEIYNFIHEKIRCVSFCKDKAFTRKLWGIMSRMIGCMKSEIQPESCGCISPPDDVNDDGIFYTQSHSPQQQPLLATTFLGQVVQKNSAHFIIEDDYSRMNN